MCVCVCVLSALSCFDVHYVQYRDAVFWILWQVHGLLFGVDLIWYEDVSPRALRAREDENISWNYPNFIAQRQKH